MWFVPKCNQMRVWRTEAYEVRPCVIDMKLATDGDTSDKFFSSFDAAIESARVDAKITGKMRNTLSAARLRKIRRVEQ